MSYVDYNYYNSEFHGKASEDDFNSVINPVVDIVKSYMEGYIASWNYQTNIEAYECDVKNAICYEVDYLLANGGYNAIAGSNEKDLQSVSVDGFSYTFKKNKVSTYKGIPFSPLSISKIKSELQHKGYLYRGVHQCSKQNT